MNKTEKCQVGGVWRLLLSCLFALSCLIMTGCSTDQAGQSVGQQDSGQSSRSEIHDIDDVANALPAAMKEVSGCEMTLEPDSKNHLSLLEGSDSVGEAELSRDNDYFTILIDGNRSGESEDSALQRVAYMTLAAVLACNSDYDYEKAQDVAVEIIEADGEYRDGRVSYRAGTKGYQYVLRVYL